MIASMALGQLYHIPIAYFWTLKEMVCASTSTENNDKAQTVYMRIVYIV